MELADDPRAFNGAMFERTSILLQAEGIKRLQECHVFLAGVGGVGGHCVEALVRAGVGSITIVDGDVVTATNKNRQLIALDDTIGLSKVQSMANRITAICQHCKVTAIDGFLLPEDMEHFLTRCKYDYVVDCIDSVDCKIALLETAANLNIPVFSSGGAGGKLDPLGVKTADLFDSKGDTLTRICRNTLKKKGVGWGKIQMVYSEEVPIPPLEPQRQENGGRDRAMNGTVSYMPSLFGLVLSSLVIRFAVNPDAAKEEIETKLRKMEKDAKRLQKEEEKKAIDRAARKAYFQSIGQKRTSDEANADNEPQTAGGGGGGTASGTASSNSANRDSSPHSKVRKVEFGFSFQNVAGSKPGAKPYTPFQIFTKEVRPQVIVDHPDLKGKDQAKEVGERWRRLSEEERRFYWTPEYTEYHASNKKKLEE